MIKNFDKIKSQLKEMADVVNAFDNESVQLKVVDMLLKGGLLPENEVKPTLKSMQYTIPEESNNIVESPASLMKRGPKLGKKKVSVKTTPKVIVNTESIAPNAVNAIKPKAKLTAKKPVKLKVVKTPLIKELVAPKVLVKTETKPVVKKAPIKKKLTTAKKATTPKVKSVINTTRRAKGPAVVLNELIAAKYFTTARKISDVVDHCKNEMNIEFAATDFSGVLMTAVTKKQLSRSKNAITKRFEYRSK